MNKGYGKGREKRSYCNNAVIVNHKRSLQGCLEKNENMKEERRAMK